MHEQSEFENQKKILDILKKNPGIHISKIAELLNMNLSDVQSHLHNLESQGCITQTSENGFTCYSAAHTRPRTRNQRIQETRKQIYDIIDKNPGLYLSKIAEMLNISVQLADYHLLYMERNKEIIAIKDPGEYYRRYYTITEKIQQKDKKILDVLGQEMLLKIVLLLLKNKTMKHKDICEKLGITSARLSYHLNKLLQSGIVDVSYQGVDKGYTLINEEEILSTLKKYKIQLGVYLSLERFSDIWKNLDLFYFRGKRTTPVHEDVEDY